MSRLSPPIYSVVFAAAALQLGVAIQLLCGVELSRDDPDGVDQAERRQKIAALTQIVANRHKAVDELLAGRQSLVQTVARFRELTAQSEFDVLPYLRHLHPGVADEELYYRHVLMYVQSNPNRWNVSEDVVHLLYAEFDEYQANALLQRATERY